MKCSKRSFAMVSLLFAELLSLSIGTLHARDADLASRTFAATQTMAQSGHSVTSPVCPLSLQNSIALGDRVSAVNFGRALVQLSHESTALTHRYPKLDATPTRSKRRPPVAAHGREA